MKGKLLFLYGITTLLVILFATAAIAENMPYDSMKMVKGASGYLYEAYYQPTNDKGYEEVKEFMKNHPLGALGCSSLRKGKLYGRNLDFGFDSAPDVVIHTPAGNGHYASVTLDGGMAERVLGFEKQRLDEILAGGTPTEKEKKLLAMLPYFALDGINEKGLVCNINVAQRGKDIEATTGTKSGAAFDLPIGLCTRYILDNCASAKEAIETLLNINIWNSVDGKEHTEYHIMIADATNTYVVEFRHNKMLVKEISKKPYMTNFNLLKSDSETIEFDEKGHVVRESAINYAGGDHHGTFDTGNAHGIERYDVIADSYAGITDKTSMRAVLDDISSGNFYKNPKSRFTELVGDNTSKLGKYIPDMGDDLRYLTLKSATENMETLCEKYKIEDVVAKISAELEREFANPYSQTIHSCIYDIDAKKVWVKEQDLGKEACAWSGEHCFSVNNEDSTSSGCNAGFGLLALLLTAPLFRRSKK